jgi:hypothetical protein
VRRGEERRNQRSRQPRFGKREAGADLERAVFGVPIYMRALGASAVTLARWRELAAPRLKNEREGGVLGLRHAAGIFYFLLFSSLVN